MTEDGALGPSPNSWMDALDELLDDIRGQINVRSP